MKDPDDSWPLILRTGYGNIFKQGRWTHTATVLIATAVNSGEDADWERVTKWAKYTEWDELTAC